MSASTAATILDGMTAEQINAMPPDDFCDAMYAEMETKPPLLSCEQIDEIESLWERERRSRRATLLILTKPWAWLQQKVTEDREFAVFVAQVMESADTAGMYKGLVDLMGAASAWAATALASREDMDEIIAEAKATAP